MDPTGRRGYIGLTLIGSSIALYWVTGLLGPSAAQHPLAHGGWLPPYSLDLEPSPLTVTVLLYAATAAGTVGLLLAWSALRRGWSPRVGRLLAGSAVTAVAFVVVAPMASDDVYSYAAYGRMVVIGRDPYTTRPIDLPDDPVIGQVPEVWQDAPSVYGPVATAEQALVMRVAGRSVRAGVMGLAWVGAAAFLATVAVLDRYAGSPAARQRAALFFGLNPLIGFNLVAGAHLDALLALAVVAAVVTVARRPALAGALAGVAVAIKLTGGLAAVGLAWHLRRRPRALAALVGAGVLVVVPAYLLAGGLTALDQARRASRLVSHATVWRPFAVRLDQAVGFATSRQVVSSVSLAAFVALAVLLWRRLPSAPGVPAAHAALAPTLAWLLAATYLLPWYHGWAWPLLALLVWSWWDELTLASTAMLTLAYVPGRDVATGGVTELLRLVRAGVGPVVLGAVIVAAVVMALSRTARSPVASEASH